MSKRIGSRIFLEYIAARTVLAGLGILPRGWAVAIGRGLSLLVCRSIGRLRRTGERNLQLAFPEMTDEERSRILHGSFENLGRLLGEFSQLSKVTPDKMHELVEYEGFENFQEAKASGRGIIYLTSHMGAWELSSFAHSAFGYPHSFLVRRLDNPRIERLVDRVRTRFGNETIDKMSAARKVLRILNDGGAVGILADINTHPQYGVFVPFFGHLACTTNGVANFALRTNALVIPAFIYWNRERKRHILRFDKALEPIRTGNTEQDIEQNTARFTEAIEGHIRSYPEQWLWIHRRWKTRPLGEPNLY
jgi:Kdo2-lipid IVA lauroyltransferase/acyltransferase